MNAETTTDPKEPGGLPHGWYDRERNLLKVHFVLGGGLVEIVFNPAEALAAYRELEHHGFDPETGEPYEPYEPVGRGANKAWWDYLGHGEDEEPHLALYRDDHFMATLPHEYGERLRDILKERFNLR
jgi:hypothetical protein